MITPKAIEVLWNSIQQNLLSVILILPVLAQILFQCLFLSLFTYFLSPSLTSGFVYNNLTVSIAMFNFFIFFISLLVLILPTNHYKSMDHFNSKSFRTVFGIIFYSILVYNQTIIWYTFFDIVSFRIFFSTVRIILKYGWLLSLYTNLSYVLHFSIFFIYLLRMVLHLCFAIGDLHISLVFVYILIFYDQNQIK